MRDIPLIIITIARSKFKIVINFLYACVFGIDAKYSLNILMEKETLL